MKLVRLWKKKASVVAVGLCLAMVQLGCDPEEVVPTPEKQPDYPYYEYHPLEIGWQYEYKIDSFYFNGGNDLPYDTQTWYLRKTVLDSATDLSGVKVYEVGLESKRGTGEYRPAGREWWALRENALVYTQNNVNKVQLEFPIIAGKSWNGNRLNAVDSSYYRTWRYDDLHQSWTKSTIASDSTVKVVIAEELNPITRMYEAEIYGKHQGLIYAEYDSLDIQLQNPSDTTKKKVSGYRIKVDLIQLSK